MKTDRRMIMAIAVIGGLISSTLLALAATRPGCTLCVVGMHADKMNLVRPRRAGAPRAPRLQNAAHYQCETHLLHTA